MISMLLVFLVEFRRWWYVYLYVILAPTELKRL